MRKNVEKVSDIQGSFGLQCKLQQKVLITTQKQLFFCVRSKGKCVIIQRKKKLRTGRGVPAGVVEPMKKLVDAIVRQVLGGTEVKPRVEFVDDEAVILQETQQKAR